MLITHTRMSLSGPAEPTWDARLATAASYPTDTAGHPNARNCVHVPAYVSGLCSPTAAVCGPAEDIWTIKNHYKKSVWTAMAPRCHKHEQQRHFFSTEVTQSNPYELRWKLGTSLHLLPFLRVAAF